MNTFDEVSGTFPNRLRAGREMQEFSQLEFAARGHLQQAAVFHDEGGTRRPSLRSLRRLFDALGVTTDYRVGRSGSSAPPPPTDESLFQDFGRLTRADRELARQRIAQWARRSGSEPK